ncbi:MAG TPA: ParB/RepB/Spo0J family partition protein [Casimicrobium huifangae]|jgi:ParB family chromosome partitioning protein|uniref:ParB/RepB/Spo0J family partition protein n=1 Tax=Casimicrobium huifangae TaxID=2591109 RepID=UPI0012EC2506|nr:ParB/RepB/Spo0J family partition protein [Casimicrobium huifangae]HOB02286.1 ParB/RepB/Spo0J family partition protein [Casimicrobium huifangae]HQA33665.1 ParB/RepB/Spo0J family partition protein [Casimicrobium huifangae]HQD63782.1 ParB/RepB/Spo0J family partition protein [Casimicrobium huifangae]
MAVKLKGLGRGLDALLMPEPTRVDAPAAGVTSLKVADMIAGKYQPRRRFDDASLAELSASIKAQGIMQPIVVRKTVSGKHEIIAGERRFRAAQLAGLAEVPVIVKEVDDKTALTLALIENLQRQDLNAIEEAHGLQRLIAEFSFTHEQAAEAVGKSRSAVSNLLRLLELAAPVQDRVIAGTLEMGHARALATLPKDKQVMLAEKIAINDLSVRATEALVKEESSATGKRPGVPTAKSKQGKLDLPATRDPDLDRLETELADALGTYVSIVHQSGGQGELVIRYASLDQLDGLIARMKR